MPRVCTVCRHPRREAIDLALVERRGSYRAIARQFRVSKDALGRHLVDHLPEALAKAQEAKDVADSTTLLARLASINATTLEILGEARSAKDGTLALQAIGRVEKQVELQAKLVGEIQDGASVNILLSPEWRQLQGAVLRALEPYPDARATVARQLVAGGSHAAGA